MKTKIPQPYLNYILDMSKEVGIPIKMEDIQHIDMERYTYLADQLDELYKKKEINEALDTMLAEVNEYGKDYVMKKYKLGEYSESK